MKFKPKLTSLTLQPIYIGLDALYSKMLKARKPESTLPPPFRSLYDIITCICTHNIPLSYLQNERREEKWLSKVYHNFFQHDDNHITFGYFHLPGFFSNNQIVCESLVWLLIYYLPQTHKSDIILRLYFHVNNTESRSTHR